MLAEKKRVHIIVNHIHAHRKMNPSNSGTFVRHSAEELRFSSWNMDDYLGFSYF